MASRCMARRGGRNKSQTHGAHNGSRSDERNISSRFVDLDERRQVGRHMERQLNASHRRQRPNCTRRPVPRATGGVSDLRNSTERADLVAWHAARSSDSRATGHVWVTRRTDAGQTRGPTLYTFAVTKLWFHLNRFYPVQSDDRWNTSSFIAYCRSFCIFVRETRLQD